jgi:hypothetical protein
LLRFADLRSWSSTWRESQLSGKAIYIYIELFKHLVWSYNLHCLAHSVTICHPIVRMAGKSHISMAQELSLKGKPAGRCRLSNPMRINSWGLPWNKRFCLVLVILVLN